MAPRTPTVESQMPLANFDYWDIDNAGYALYCWIKGLKPDQKGASNAEAPIDYDRCGRLPDELRPRRQGGKRARSPRST